MTEAYVKAFNCNLYFMEAMEFGDSEYCNERIMESNEFLFTIPVDEIDTFNNLNLEEKLNIYKNKFNCNFKLIYSSEGHYAPNLCFVLKSREYINYDSSYITLYRLKVVNSDMTDSWFVRGMTRPPEILFEKDISINEILEIEPDFFECQKKHESDIRAMIEHEFVDELKESIKEEINNFGKHVRENYTGEDTEFAFESSVHHYRNVPLVLTYHHEYENDEMNISKMYITIDARTNEEFYSLISDLFHLEYSTWWLETEIDIFDEDSINQYVDELIKLVIKDVDLILKEIPSLINKKYKEVKKLDEKSKVCKHW